MPPSDVLRALALPLPPAPKPVGAYTPCLRMGNLLYTSGHLPLLPDGTLLRGKVGVDLDADAGKAAARQVACAILATVENALGSVDRVKRVVKVLGMVNAVPEYADHPKVINGCSDLFVNVLGDAGRHARSAVGMGSLPGRITVEIEAILQVDG